MQSYPRFNRVSALLIVVTLAVVLIGPRASAQEPPRADVAAATTETTQAALGTSIPYQGQLNDGANPANGAYDFQFKLFDDAGAGTQVGVEVHGEDVAVANGLFSVALDFGGVFNGEARYLEIGVRPGASTGAYTMLSPRRPLLAVPYALYSLASAGGSGGNPAYGAAAGAPANSVYVTTDGNVGIGTAEPGFPLVVNGRIVSRSALSVFNPNPANNSAAAALEWINDVATMRIGGELPGALNGFEFIGGSSRTSLLRIAGSGNVGIGTAEPGFPLDVNGRIVSRSALSVFNPNPANNNAAVALEWINDVATMRIGGGLPGALNGFEFIGGSSRTSLLRINGFGNVGIGTTTPSAKLDVAGTARTDILVIDAGSDLAEPFDINGADTIEPGMVVAIDPDNPGQLRLATAAYDRTVAGVVSGAGGINPGLILQQEGTVAAGEHPVALSGRVYVYADATNGAIEPGDLLTTAATRGHAMKVTDYDRAQGAILGKAMSRLEDGTGLVLILVTLQ